MQDSISELITTFIASKFPQAEIGQTDDLCALGYVDSLFVVELVIFIEKAFEVTISDDDLRIDNFRTVKLMVELVAGPRSGTAVA